MTTALGGFESQGVRADARRLFANQGLHQAAEFIASLDPRAIDYLQQAPVLALAFGAKRGTRADRRYVAMRIGGPISRGERLRNVMAAVGIPYPFRKLSPSILSPSSRATVRALSAVNPSTISQIIPAKSGDQRKWFIAFNAFCHRCSMRAFTPCNDALQWVAQQTAIALPYRSEAGDFADFLASNPGAPYQRWSWDRAMCEVTQWHDRLSLEKRLPAGIRPETVIDYGRYPDHADVSGFEFFKLATPSMMMEEGRRMRHCVASYLPDVMNGTCSIFSIRHEMRRLATVQISKNTVIQIKGFANKLASKPVCEAADRFAKVGASA